VEYDFGNAMTCSPQSWNQLGNRRGKNNEMSRGVWITVETEAGKIRVVKVKRRREKGRK